MPEVLTQANTVQKTVPNQSPVTVKKLGESSSADSQRQRSKPRYRKRVSSGDYTGKTKESLAALLYSQSSEATPAPTQHTFDMLSPTLEKKVGSKISMKAKTTPNSPLSYNSLLKPESKSPKTAQDKVEELDSNLPPLLRAPKISITEPRSECSSPTKLTNIPQSIPISKEIIIHRISTPPIETQLALLEEDSLVAKTEIKVKDLTFKGPHVDKKSKFTY